MLQKSGFYAEPWLNGKIQDIREVLAIYRALVGLGRSIRDRQNWLWAGRADPSLTAMIAVILRHTTEV